MGEDLHTSETPVQAAENDSSIRSIAIGDAELKAAQDTLQRYKEGKANLDNRVIENEDWWKLQHWRNFKNPHGEGYQDKRQAFNQKPTSAWLFNSIMMKHADAMDNYPDPAVLPRARDDEAVAKVLSSILPVIMDNVDFEQTYSDNWWDKLKNGAGIYGVFFNPKLENGLGDIDIRAIDILDLYWEPGVQDIQDSKNLFLLTLTDNQVLESQYPQVKGRLRENVAIKKEYRYDDHVDTTHKSVVVDWYYKVERNGRTILHYCKWVDDIVLYASEDDPQYEERGFYDHGKYPFVVDVLFLEKGTPAGFGYVDVMRSPQEYIDRLGSSIIDNAQWAAKPRYFAKDGMSINEDEFLDTNKQIVHVAGSVNEDNIRVIETKELSGNVLNVRQSLVDELKETSGNRDFSQGTTTAGVTAASAIAALQEAGSKGSRDMIKGAYRAYTEICQIVIELIRQFYDETRTFRIIGESGEPDYVDFNNYDLQPVETQEFGLNLTTKAPVFDIKVKAQRSNPYSRTAQNELALQFYQLGFFNPQMVDQAISTIDMMDFDGKEKVRDTIRKNGTLFEQLQQAQQVNLQLAQLLAEQTGDARPLQALQQQMGMAVEPQPQATEGQPQRKGSLAEQAAEHARNATEVK